jgi:hypothetical protein
MGSSHVSAHRLPGSRAVQLPAKERLHGGIEWKTPAEVYNDKRLMRKAAIKLQ